MINTGNCSIGYNGRCMILAYRKLYHKSIYDATNNRDEIEGIPIVFKIAL